MQSVTQTVVTGIIKNPLEVSKSDTVSLVEQSSHLWVTVVMTKLAVTLSGSGTAPLGLWGCSPWWVFLPPERIPGKEHTAGVARGDEG